MFEKASASDRPNPVEQPAIDQSLALSTVKTLLSGNGYGCSRDSNRVIVAPKSSLDLNFVSFFMAIF